jgi:DNA-binding LytR/AlgR family response regulator
MRKTSKSSEVAAPPAGHRLLLHVAAGLRQAVDADAVYYVEAKADDCQIRMRGTQALRDVRPIEVLAAAFARPGFVRIHRSYLVNVGHVRLVRRRKRSDDWEVTLEAPVNSILPVSRSARRALWRALGED